MRNVDLEYYSHPPKRCHVYLACKRRCRQLDTWFNIYDYYVITWSADEFILFVFLENPSYDVNRRCINHAGNTTAYPCRPAAPVWRHQQVIGLILWLWASNLVKKSGINHDNSSRWGNCHRLSRVKENGNMHICDTRQQTDYLSPSLSFSSKRGDCRRRWRSRPSKPHIAL